MKAANSRTCNDAAFLSPKVRAFNGGPGRSRSNAGRMLSPVRQLLFRSAPPHGVGVTEIKPVMKAPTMNTNTKPAAQVTNLTSDDQHWLIDNSRLLLLLRSEKIPLLKCVLDARNDAIDCHERIDNDLLMHLIELSVRHEDHWRGEQTAYQPVADYLGGVVVAGPSCADVVVAGAIPVEIKNSPIKAQAVFQLKRYMASMGSDFGIVCGTSLTTNLPDGIKFLQISYNEHEESYVVIGGENVKLFLEEVLK